MGWVSPGSPVVGIQNCCPVTTCHATHTGNYIIVVVCLWLCLSVVVVCCSCVLWFRVMVACVVACCGCVLSVVVVFVVVCLWLCLCVCSCDCGCVFAFVIVVVCYVVVRSGVVVVCYGCVFVCCGCVFVVVVVCL